MWIFLNLFKLILVDCLGLTQVFILYSSQKTVIFSLISGSIHDIALNIL